MICIRKLSRAGFTIDSNSLQPIFPVRKKKSGFFYDLVFIFMHNYTFRKFYVVKCGGAVEVGFRFFLYVFL